MTNGCCTQSKPQQFQLREGCQELNWCVTKKNKTKQNRTKQQQRQKNNRKETAMLKTTLKFSQKHQSLTLLSCFYR